MIYLDSAATTKPAQEVVLGMENVMRENYGNPGSIHLLGERSAEAIRDSRSKVAQMLGTNPGNILFTSGGTESNNLALLGVRDYLLQSGKTHLIASSVEHPSVMKVLQFLEHDGFQVSYIPVDQNGVIRFDVLESMCDARTGLVAVMYVNNETGSVQPVEKIGRLCAERGILFHCDCVQAAGFNIIDVELGRIDFASISAHKMHGPKGIGCLYARRPDLLTPQILGGGQEAGLRSGTENVSGIVGFGIAATLWSSAAIARTLQYKQWFATKLLNHYKDHRDKVWINGDPDDFSKVLNVTFHGYDAESIVLQLAAAGICVSSGSACHSHSDTASYVLRAMGLSEDDARSSVRFSFSRDLEEDEIVETFSQICSIVKF